MSDVVGGAGAKWCEHNAYAIGQCAEPLLAPLECTVCGQATGPVYGVEVDHAGWICESCYSLFQESSEASK